MPSYNTKEAILARIGRPDSTLDDLHEVINARSKAGYENLGSLEPFCLLGRWLSDNCGNLGLVNPAPADLHKECPPVLSDDEMHLICRGEGVSASFRYPPPQSFNKCPVCEKGWSLSDCHDFVAHEEYDEYPLESFVGVPFNLISCLPRLEGKHEYFLSKESVYNDNYDGPNGGCGANGKKWKYVQSDYVIEPGDRAMVRIRVYEHKACHKQAVARKTRGEFRELFRKAGTDVDLVSIPNEYCPCDECPPWYLAQVEELPPIKIGWRKRVVNIDWSASKKTVGSLFEDQKVTQGEHYIHAWSYDKASEYLAKLLPVLRT